MNKNAISIIKRNVQGFKALQRLRKDLRVEKQQAKTYLKLYEEAEKTNNLFEKQAEEWKKHAVELSVTINQKQDIAFRNIFEMIRTQNEKINKQTEMLTELHKQFFNLK